MASERFRLIKERIAYKIFHDDVVIINLATSIYYSIGGLGPTVWQMLEAGWSVDEMAEALAARFDMAAETVRGDVEKLVSDLIDQALIEPDPALSVHSDFEVNWAASAYAPVVLECYSDMQDLLALDPPHPDAAVSEAGQRE